LALGALALFGTGLAIESGALAANPPTATTGAAREVTDTTAAVAGWINPSGQATRYAFQYGAFTPYASETAVQDGGSGNAMTAVATELTGLQPGTTYHFRLLATNASGTSVGSDLTFRTGGIAPPPGTSLIATTGLVTNIDAHDASLNGTIEPSGPTVGSTVNYYFQLGTQFYELETLGQALRSSSATVPVSARLIGLQSDHLYHYRLVAMGESGVTSAGADRTFSTAPTTRLNPRAIQAFASPVFQRRLPDIVTVSGRLLPPRSLQADSACHGFVDITFRVRTVAIQLLRAGLRSDCTFSLPVRFSVRRRLRGGRVEVYVLFPGNQFLNRLAAPVQSIQIG
jgi:hypothetical protein